MLMKLIIMLLIATSLVGCKNKAAAPAEPAQAEAFSFESIDVGASYVDIARLLGIVVRPLHPRNALSV